MQLNFLPPEVNDNPAVPMIRVVANPNVTATLCYSITVPSRANRYAHALTWDLTDDECDLLVEQLAAARSVRLMAQEQAYEALRARFGGEWDNRPAAGFDGDTDGEPATDDTHPAP